uniref:Uncharacterized protein n=1 Tax=Setaria italica TaxID=4555 RepID=K3YB24_SETIT
MPLCSWALSFAKPITLNKTHPSLIKTVTSFLLLMPPKLPLMWLLQTSISNLNRISPLAVEYGETIERIAVVHAWWQEKRAMGSMNPSTPAGATCPATAAGTRGE